MLRYRSGHTFTGLYNAFILSIPIWLIIILLCCSCAIVRDIKNNQWVVHDPEMTVISIDLKNETVLMRGQTIYPQGFYYAMYPLSRFENVQEGMVFKVSDR